MSNCYNYQKLLISIKRLVFKAYAKDLLIVFSLFD